MKNKNELLVVKSNALNSCIYNPIGNNILLGVRELKLLAFSISLIKYQPEKEVQTIRLYERDIMEVMGYARLNRNDILRSAHLLSKADVNIQNSDNTYTCYNLFAFYTPHPDKGNGCYFEYKFSEALRDHLYKLTNNFTQYELWNILALNSVYQIRMFEFLAQNLYRKELDIKVSDLRYRLGINDDMYSGRTGWTDFKKSVLDRCKKVLREKTSIVFDYRKGEQSRNGVWNSIHISIKKNNQFKNPYYEKFNSSKPIVAKELCPSAITKEAELEVIRRYRNHCDTDITDQGILNIDMKIRTLVDFCLEKRIRLFLTVFKIGTAKAKKTIDNPDTYFLKCVTNKLIEMQT